MPPFSESGTPNSNLAILQDTPFLYHMMHQVQHDIPALNLVPIALGAAKIAVGLSALVAEQCQIHKDAQAGVQKTINDIFGDRGGQHLLLLAQVAIPTQLPSVYQQLASGPKVQCLATLQNSIDTKAELVCPGCSFIVRLLQQNPLESKLGSSAGGQMKWFQSLLQCSQSNDYDNEKFKKTGTKVYSEKPTHMHQTRIIIL